MTAPVLDPHDVAGYLARVRAELADLPADERDELLVDVEASLHDAAAEGEPPATRLGPPEEFARELRAAAGLGAPETPPAAPATPLSLTERGRSLVADLRGDPRLQGPLRVARELAPLWWVARAYIAVLVLAIMGGSHYSGDPILALIIAGGVSVWIGFRARRGGRLRTASVVASAFLLLAALPALATNDDRSDIVQDYAYAVPEGVAGLTYNGTPVANVYPYDRDGDLLLDVRLYDQNGEPLEVHAGDPEMDPERRVPATREGEPAWNAFPIRYYEPGTRTVANPFAGGMTVPKLTTPPLEAERAASTPTPKRDRRPSSKPERKRRR